MTWMTQQQKCYFLATLILSAGWLTGCGQSAPDVPAPAVQQWTLPVATVESGAPLEYTSVGSIISDHRVEVASRLSGYIRELLVQEGDRVTQGQVLARLDAADVEGAIRQARAGVRSAEAALRDAAADLQNAERLRSKGSVSDNEWRKTHLRHAAATEALNQANASLTTATAQQHYTEIRSPIAGVVVARLRRAGDLAVPGAPLLTLESGEQLIFETFVPESQFSLIRLDTPVTLQIDGLTTALPGTVSRVVSSADPVTRTYPVKIALPDAAAVMPGMFGRARFVLGTRDVPLLPVAALIERGGLSGAFVLDAQNSAHFRWLRLGREWPGQVEVTAGLSAGERVVMARVTRLREGDTVTPDIAALEEVAPAAVLPVAVESGNSTP